MCVQNFDDSRGPAIRITYRISLRSSSLWDPRHPLLKVVMNYTARGTPRRGPNDGLGSVPVSFSSGRHRGGSTGQSRDLPRHLFFLILLRGAVGTGSQCVGTPSQPPFHGDVRFGRCDNDPSAGSPTETLLRLHLPLNDKVWTSSHGQAPMKEPNHNPESSPDHSIGRCDGRCVQRAGT